MKGKQISILDEVDRFEAERKKRKADEIRARLDAKYERMDFWKMRNKEYPAGSVVIIGQRLWSENRDRLHFYRTVLNYYTRKGYEKAEIFVEATNEEFPERPPWADTVGHEGERRDIDFYREHIHWITGEIVEPIATWWMKEWRMEYEQLEAKREEVSVLRE